MKKNLLLIGLVLTLSLSASAQYKGFSFGFKAGPNFGWAGSSTNTATPIKKAVRTGADIGFIAEYYFTDNYAIVTGIDVSFLGGHYAFDNGRMVMTNDTIPVFETFQVDRTYKTTLYELPLMLKLVTNDLNMTPFRVYAQVGAGVGYNHKVTVKDGIDGGDISDTWEKTNKEYSNLRVSLKIGAGAQYTIEDNLRVFAGIYFSHDVVNNINWVKPNYAGYYIDSNGEEFLDADGNKIKRDAKLNLLQNRIGIEVGILF